MFFIQTMQNIDCQQVHTFSYEIQDRLCGRYRPVICQKLSSLLLLRQLLLVYS